MCFVLHMIAHAQVIHELVLITHTHSLSSLSFSLSRCGAFSFSYVAGAHTSGDDPLPPVPPRDARAVADTSGYSRLGSAAPATPTTYVSNTPGRQGARGVSVSSPSLSPQPPQQVTNAPGYSPLAATRTSNTSSPPTPTDARAVAGTSGYSRLGSAAPLTPTTYVAVAGRRGAAQGGVPADDDETRYEDLFSRPDQYLQVQSSEGDYVVMYQDHVMLMERPESEKVLHDRPSGSFLLRAHEKTHIVKLSVVNATGVRSQLCMILSLLFLNIASLRLSRESLFVFYCWRCFVMAHLVSTLCCHSLSQFSYVFPSVSSIVLCYVMNHQNLWICFQTKSILISTQT